MAIKRCIVCLDYVDSRGRPSKSGDYYCSAPDCRRQRNADRARAARAAEAAKQPGDHCEHCGVTVYPRRPSSDGTYYCTDRICRSAYERKRTRRIALDKENNPPVVTFTKR